MGVFSCFQSQREVKRDVQSAPATLEPASRDSPAKSATSVPDGASNCSVTPRRPRRLLLRSTSSAARCWLAGRRSAPASTVAAAGIGSPTSPGIPEEISCGEFSVAEVRATTRSAPPPAARLLLAGASQLCRRCSATQSSGS